VGGTIYFSSISWAIQARKLLERQGMPSNMRKISKIGSGGGCGYGLDLQRGDVNTALHLLNNAGIKYIDPRDIS